MPKPNFDYNEVADRVRGFNEEFPEGCIHTELLHLDIPDHVGVRASVWKKRPDGGVLTQPDSTGMSWLKVPGSTNFTRGSEIENAETSAVGRALAFIGFYAKGESLASKQEIAAKKQSGDLTEEAKVVFREEAEASVVGRGLTDGQRKKLFATLRENGIEDKDRKKVVFDITEKASVKEMTGEDLDKVIAYFKAGAK